MEQEKTNENVFDEIEQEEQKVDVATKENSEKQMDLNGKDAISKVEALKKKREEVMEGGSLEEVKQVDEELKAAQEEEDKLKAPSLEDLDDTPSSEKYNVVQPSTEWPKEGKVLKIERVRLQPPYTTDFEGNTIEPQESKNGKYYKAKMILEFEESDGVKYKQGIPSIYYGVNEKGEVNSVPGMPQACDESQLDDPMTSSLAKLRRIYADFIGKDAKDISNKEFAQGLVGKKVNMKKVSGKYQGREWAKLIVDKFVE